MTSEPRGLDDLVDALASVDRGPCPSRFAGVGDCVHQRGHDGPHSDGDKIEWGNGEVRLTIEVNAPGVTPDA